MYHFIVTTNAILSRKVMSIRIAMCVLGLLLGTTAFARNIVPIGQITLTVGQTTITSASDETRPARRGDSIFVGDRIETTINGHVHVQFVDGALVSVRPTSELLIEEYRYDPAAAEKSQVKFKLSRGTARAISGAAAEGARDHFRLNTPLVAIGIRGTDFVVHSTDSLTTAAVSYGAIIMAPFGDGCKAQGSGPCTTPAARLLSADMSGMLAEYKNGLGQAELKHTAAYNAQMSDLARPASAGNAKSTPATGSGSTNAAVASSPSISGTAGTAAVAAPEVTLVAVNDLLHLPYRTNSLVDADTRNTSQVTTAAVLAAESIKPAALVVSPTVPPVVVAPPPPVIVPAPPKVVAPPPVVATTVTPIVEAPAMPIVPPIVVALPTTLVWGRWGTDAAGQGDFSVVRSDAQSGRTLTIGNDKFVLYRNDGDFDFSRFASSQGETGFVLDKSFAQYTDSSGKAEAASVLGGLLGINFSTRQFSTALNMTSAATGAQSLAVQGAIDLSGFFVAGQDGQRVAGAIALDGKSAGYLFDKTVSSGSLSGITQWKVK